jgi:hypothetical protein
MLCTKDLQIPPNAKHPISSAKVTETPHFQASLIRTTTALISLQEYEEALKYLSELGPSFPLDKSHAVLQKEARDGIARSKKAEQQAWRGKLKSPSAEQLSPSSSSPLQTLSSAGPMPLWMALAALSVGGAVLFSFLLHLYGAVPEEDSQQQSKSI